MSGPEATEPWPGRHMVRIFAGGRVRSRSTNGRKGSTTGGVIHRLAVPDRGARPGSATANDDGTARELIAGMTSTPFANTSRSIARAFSVLLSLAFVACAAPASDETGDDGDGEETAALTSAADAVLYLGVNSASIAHETGGLGAEAPLILATGRKPNATASIGDAIVDLTTDEGRDAFVASLGAIDASARDWLLRFLRYAPATGRDELAQLVMLLRDADQGRIRIRRVVFSGHSGGLGLTGEAPDDATLQFDTLPLLQRLYPRALGAVEHLAISACNTARSINDGTWLFQTYRDIFPQARTIWAYRGTSPTIPGSTEHLRAWERATRPGADATQTLERARRSLAARGGNYGHVRVWLEGGRILGE